MAWAGTLTKTAIDGQEVLELDFTGFDANGEESHALSPVDGYDRWQATDAVMYVTAAHASAVTDAVDIALQGSAFGVQWTDLISITDADVDNGGGTAEDSAEVAATRFAPSAYQYFRILCTTVGAGNTLRAFVKLTKAP
ncbi:hypothetical protein LCGC14_0547620 [marine sediment metagenome]|uniref:Uncharacterized protein n=1 Tax=marine sediment metagenome TaxID=412755 RepID=A0A0F9RQX1_9ZZZZ